MTYDVLIVGSGASGVNAAYPLVEAGLKVAMLDFGNTDESYDHRIPKKSFMELRRTDPRQHEYFLGHTFEGIAVGAIKPGAQLTPPRQFIIKDTETATPVISHSVVSFSTLARGGLASAWGAGTYGYSEENLRNFPITRDKLAPHYEIIAERIGISGENDDLARFDGELKNLLPPLEIDGNANAVYEQYRRHRNALNAKGFFMGKTRLAALSTHYRGRKADRYLDMSFWSDDESVWRPHHTLKELQQRQNFAYIPSLLVREFKENQQGVEIRGTTRSGDEFSYHGKKVILCAGVIGTARIVLRSLNMYEQKIPFVCNPYTYYPMLNLHRLGSSIDENALSLAPLCVSLIPEPGKQPIHGRVHSYRSLLSFKIIKEMPLPFPWGIRLMRAILPAFMVVALDHEDMPSPEKYVVLHRGNPDMLQIEYALSPEIRNEQIRQEKRIIRTFRTLGCIALKRVWPGFGASLHYGGTFPMSNDERPLTTSPEGLLRGTRHVYIADGSVFPYLPAKGLTFTMMANADRIGALLACRMLEK